VEEATAEVVQATYAQLFAEHGPPLILKRDNGGPFRRGRTVPHTSGAPRLALHAAEIGFVHPATDENIQFTMPLPADLQRFLEAIRQ
jgi:hypothetical protein